MAACRVGAGGKAGGRVGRVRRALDVMHELRAELLLHPARRVQPARQLAVRLLAAQRRVVAQSGARQRATRAGQHLLVVEKVADVLDLAAVLSQQRRVAPGRVELVPVPLQHGEIREQAAAVGLRAHLVGEPFAAAKQPFQVHLAPLRRGGRRRHGQRGRGLTTPQLQRSPRVAPACERARASLRPHRGTRAPTRGLAHRDKLVKEVPPFTPVRRPAALWEMTVLAVSLKLPVKETSPPSKTVTGVEGAPHTPPHTQSHHRFLTLLGRPQNWRRYLRAATRTSWRPPRVAP